MSEMNKVRHTIERGSKDAASILDDVKEQFNDLVEEAKEKRDVFLDQARERGTELMVEAQKRGQKALKGAGTWIQKNPGRAVAVALAAGFILHALYSREE